MCSAEDPEVKQSSLESGVEATKAQQKEKGTNAAVGVRVHGRAQGIRARAG